MTQRSIGVTFGILLSAALLRPIAQVGSPQAPPPPGATPLDLTVRPFVETYCAKCHSAARTEGDINLQQLVATRDSIVTQRAVWESIADVLQIGKMPPQGETRPSPTDVEAVIAAVTSALAEAGPRPADSPKTTTRDWTTFGFDAERSGWARAETALTMTSVSRLGLLWKTQLDTVPNPSNTNATLTDPLVVEGVSTRLGTKTVIFLATGENGVYALDSDGGAVIWQKSFPNPIKAPSPPSSACPNNLNATPVIDKAASTIYVLATDGKLRGLRLSDGEVTFGPVSFVPAYSRNFALNLIDGRVFGTTTRGCGGAISEIASMDLRAPDHPVSHFYTSPGKGSGPWGKGAVVKIPTGIVAQTADGPYDPAGGRFGQTVLSLTNDLRLIDSYTPANEPDLNAKDLDLGSGTPLVFPFDKWTLVAVAAKEGVIYLLDVKKLGGDDHRTPLYLSPRYGNDAVIFGYSGVWNAMATWVDPHGERWLFVPMYGPTAKDTVSSFPMVHGEVANGSVMAFKVQLKDGKPTLVPVWNSGDLDLPGTPIVANGVVFVLASGDRGSQLARGGGRGGFAPGGPPGAPGAGGNFPRGVRGGGRGGGAGAAGAGGAGGRRGRALPTSEVNPDLPGSETDAAWRAAQMRRPDEGGQNGGSRYTGGRELTHAVLYALDAATGAELYSSADLIDSWNHYGGLALSNGALYVSTYDARVFAFGVGKH